MATSSPTRNFGRRVSLPQIGHLLDFRRAREVRVQHEDVQHWTAVDALHVQRYRCRRAHVARRRDGSIAALTLVNTMAAWSISA